MCIRLFMCFLFGGAFGLPASMADELSLSTMIRPPATGEYEFFFSTVQAEIEFQATLEVDGNRLESASADTDQKKVRLTLNSNRLIPGEFAYKFRQARRGEAHEAMPISFSVWWMRPDGVQQPIPDSACHLQNGMGVIGNLSSPEPRSKVNVGPVELSSLRLVYWLGSDDPACQNRDLQVAAKRLLKKVAQQRAASDQLDELPYFWPYFSSTERLGILQRMSKSKRLLSRLKNIAACDLYRIARYDSVDQAASFIGRWVRQRNRMGLATGSISENGGQSFAKLATVMLLDSSWQALEDQYLVLADGSCSVVGAYVVAGCHSGNGTTQQWKQRIEHALDSELSSDAKVTWLIATAASSEFTSKRIGKNVAIEYSPNPNSEHLIAAQKAAESDEARILVARERITRFVSANRLDKAKDIAKNTERLLLDSGALTELVRICDELELIEESNTPPSGKKNRILAD